MPPKLRDRRTLKGAVDPYSDDIYADAEEEEKVSRGSYMGGGGPSIRSPPDNDDSFHIPDNISADTTSDLTAEIKEQLRLLTHDYAKTYAQVRNN